MRKIYAQTLYTDPSATLDDLREAVTTSATIEPTARRMLGGEHPTAAGLRGKREMRRKLLSRIRRRPANRRQLGRLYFLPQDAIEENTVE